MMKQELGDKDLADKYFTRWKDKVFGKGKKKKKKGKKKDKKSDKKSDKKQSKEPGTKKGNKIPCNKPLETL